MNKKLVIVTLLLSLAGTNIVPTQPGFAIEMTWPLSALLFILPAKELSKIIKNISINSSHYWYCQPNASPEYCTIQCPQTSGYFASSNSFDLVLQAGVNIGNFTSNNGPYASPIFYFSDITRTLANYPQNDQTESLPWLSWGAPTYSKGPSQYYVRGLGSNPGGGSTLIEGLGWALFGTNYLYTTNGNAVQTMKQYSLQNAQGITIQPNLISTNLFPYKTPSGNSITPTYYFAQTGADIYIPLHMISPGDDIAKADPDYLNYGPPPGNPTYNTPIINDPIKGTILPWTYGYAPRNIPAQLTNQQESTSPGNGNKIKF